MWDVFVSTVASEFSDLSDVRQLIRVTVRLVFAALLGALIGYERERHDSAAGLRTHMLVALGSAMFVVVPLESGMSAGDLSRVLQGVVAGIGFLGAGAVLKLSGEKEIHGLTTAASIWITAAVGITAGMGREATALLATAMVLFILAALLRVERRRRRRRGGSSNA
jgi:putative Mg2+ transporter-C (MgtC) family protein